MLDWITRGRVILGLGSPTRCPTSRRSESARPADRDLRGGARPARPLFAGEPYTYEGKHFTSEAHITPRPYTLPGPSLGQRPLQSASSAPRAAATSGSPTRSATCRRSRSSPVTYRRRAAEHGKTPRVGIFREAWIGDCRRSASGSGPPTRAVHRLYYNVGVYKKRFEPWVDDAATARTSPDQLAPGRFLYGSPEEVRAEVEEWRELTGSEYLALRFRHPGGPTHAETLEALAASAPRSSPPGGGRRPRG